MEKENYEKRNEVIGIEGGNVEGEGMKIERGMKFENENVEFEGLIEIKGEIGEKDGVVEIIGKGKEYIIRKGERIN